MKLLIDGYNLLRYITRRPARQADLDQFLGRLRRYSRATGHQLTIVFDGGEGLYRYQGTYHGLTLWYSGARQTADDVIKDLLPHYHADEVMLISDDRQLNESAEALSIVSVSPAVFVDRMRAREGDANNLRTRKASSLVKTATDSSDELDALMGVTTNRMPNKEKTEQNTGAMLDNKKRSKLERRLDALIQKL